MTAAARRGRPRDEAIDAAIREAALAELELRGIVAVTMEGIAQRAGVAKTTLYRRWSNTTDLCVDAMQSLFIPPEPPPEGSGVEQLRWLVQRARLTWKNERYAAIMRRVAADGTANPEMFNAARDRLVGPAVELMAAALEQAVDEGDVRPDADLALARRMMVAPIVAAAFTLRPPLSRAEADAVVDMVLRGLAP